MVLKIFLEKKVRRQLDELSKELEQRIITTLKELENGFSAIDMKKLKGTKNHYRIRVGNYRILFVLEFNTVYVYDVSHRGQAYK